MDNLRELNEVRSRVQVDNQIELFKLYNIDHASPTVRELHYHGLRESDVL